MGVRPMQIVGRWGRLWLPVCPVWADGAVGLVRAWMQVEGMAISRPERHWGGVWGAPGDGGAAAAPLKEACRRRWPCQWVS